MSILDHSGHLRGFNQNCSTSASIVCCLLNNHFRIVNHLWRKLSGPQSSMPHLKHFDNLKSDSVYSSQILLRSDILLFCVRILLSPILGTFWRVKFKGDFSVHWLTGPNHFFMLFFSVWAAAYASVPIVDALFQVPSFPSIALISSIQTVLSNWVDHWIVVIAFAFVYRLNNVA